MAEIGSENNKSNGNKDTLGRPKSTGRPRSTPEYRLGRLVLPSVKLIEDVVNGTKDDVSATRLNLCWKIVERYGSREEKKKISSFESLVVGE